ncbi:lytic transglycosylase [Motiliproteus coralliicola]|uniref:Lytic transglycosylase n=2 Tax=Motiliproteus coralliicola TaxID=2283196 RepID=A0A369WMY6_9GAMM|nr:lytic transglycosylase [Motiliproteus coralliicola]
MQMATDYEKARWGHHDYGRARQLYCAAARLGHTPAQLRLAWMYANGVGSPQDRGLAGAWLRVAVAGGSAEARRFLAFLNYPPRDRDPRCTWDSRFDEYALVEIPVLPVEDHSPIYGESITTWAEGIGGEAAAGDPSVRQIKSWVRRLAPQYGLEPDLVLAMIRVESNFNPRARSHKNAWGLMQLIPETAARFGVRDSTHPIQNLHGGMAYLRWLLAYFPADLRLALAGYNAGEGAVEKYRGVPPYHETRQYIRKVLRFYGRNSHPPVERVVNPSRIVPTDRQ